MTFGLRSTALQRLLSLWPIFRDRIRTAFVQFSSLGSLTNRPTCDVESVRAGSRSSAEYRPARPWIAGEKVNSKVECSQELESTKADTEVITRDAKGQFVYGGLTGIVELLDNGTVIKSPFPGSEMDDHIRDIAMEASVYRRLGRHERLVRLVRHSKDGLVLENMEKGDLKVYLQAHHSSSIPMSLKFKWAHQVAEAVELLHDHSIIHCDIKPRNFPLDAALNIKIIDFSGSSINGSKPTSGEETRFYLPRHWREPPTPRTSSR